MNGLELRALRLRLKLTQRQMAEKLGITRSGIAQAEAGSCKISKTMALLAGYVDREFTDHLSEEA